MGRFNLLRILSTAKGPWSHIAETLWSTFFGRLPRTGGVVTPASRRPVHLMTIWGFFCFCLSAPFRLIASRAQGAMVIILLFNDRRKMRRTFTHDKCGVCVTPATHTSHGRAIRLTAHNTVREDEKKTNTHRGDSRKRTEEERKAIKMKKSRMASQNDFANTFMTADDRYYDRFIIKISIIIIRSR